MPAENPQLPSQISLQLLSCYSIPPPDAADCGLFKAREPFQKKCHYHIQLVCLSAHPSKLSTWSKVKISSSYLPDPSVYEHSILCRIEDIISKMITAAASAKITAKTSHHHSVHQYLGVWGPKVMDGGFFVLRASRCSRSAASIHSCSNFSVATKTSCMKAYSEKKNQNKPEWNWGTDMQKSSFMLFSCTQHHPASCFNLGSSRIIHSRSLASWRAQKVSALRCPPFFPAHPGSG